MATTPNVTTPGGFFVGLGGIVCFSVVAAAVYFWVKAPANTGELHAQQLALGLRAADDAKNEDVKKKDAEVKMLTDQAAQRYNGGVSPDLDKLEDLRGVIRYRESQKALAEAGKALTAAPAWKDKAKGEVTMPIDLAMNLVANGLKDRKPKASAVKVDIFPALDPNAPPMMPNAMGGGAKTIIFADPNAPAPAPVPAAAPAPTAVPAPAPTAAPAPAPTAVPAPAAPKPPSGAVPAPAPPNPASPPAAPANPAPVPAPSSPTPAPAPAPPPPAPAPSPGAASATTATSAAVAGVPAPARPTLLNWPEPKK